MLSDPQRLADAVAKLTGRYVHPAEQPERLTAEALEVINDRLERLEKVAAGRARRRPTDT